MRPIHPTSARPRTDRVPAQVVRCACAKCGTHTNAVKAFRVAGSCANCGSYDLQPIDGAEPLAA